MTAIYNRFKTPILDQFNANALHRAILCKESYKKTTELLTATNLSSVDIYGNTPLHWAVYCEDIPIIRLLSKNMSSLDTLNTKKESALHIAINKENTKAVATLLQAGANPNIKTQKGTAPIFSTFFLENLTIFKLLIKHDANLCEIDSSGKSLLIWAAIQNRSLAVAELLLRGANPKQRDNEGKTALDWAIEEQNYQKKARYLPTIRLLKAYQPCTKAN